MIGSDFLQLNLGGLPAGQRTARLTAELRQAISDGRLPVGTLLPPSRVLAAELGCARGTVTEAYHRLCDEALLLGQIGSGTRVAARPSPAAPATRPAAADPASTATPTQLDLAHSLPDLTAFPRAAWLRAERTVLDAARAADFGYAPVAGAMPLRIQLAAWLARSRGVMTDPAGILITGGVTGAVSLLAQVMRNRGQTEIAIEEPGAIGNRRILEAWLPVLQPTAVDAEGIIPSRIASSCNAALVTPAHQYPTGVALSASRRRELLAWAERTDGLIIEDDYDAEYRYDRQPIRALQGLNPGRVAYTSSLSKTVSPGMRLGWLIAPQGWRDELIQLRWAQDLGSPVLPQLVLAELLRNGALERHLRTMRNRHRQRRNVLLAALSRELPWLTTSGLAAGLHLILHFPDDFDDVRIAHDAAASGVLVQILSAHYRGAARPGLVLNYAAHHPAEIERAIQLLARVIPKPS